MLHLGSLRFELKVQWCHHGRQRLGREPLLLLLPWEIACHSCHSETTSYLCQQLPHYSNLMFQICLESQVKHAQENLRAESSPESVCGDEVDAAKGSSDAPESVMDTGRIEE